MHGHATRVLPGMRACDDTSTHTHLLTPTHTHTNIDTYTYTGSFWAEGHSK